MAKLTEAQQRFIVQRLAYYDKPSTIVADVKEEFGIVVSRQQVHNYHPEHGQPSKKWREAFDAHRAAFDREEVQEPLAQRGVRVRLLARMLHRAEERGNVVLAASLAKQIAEEMGGAYTNRREITGKNGGPIAAGVTVRFVRPAGGTDASA
jgi:hypothetical protein